IVSEPQCPHYDSGPITCSATSNNVLEARSKTDVALFAFATTRVVACGCADAEVDPATCTHASGTGAACPLDKVIFQRNGRNANWTYMTIADPASPGYRTFYWNYVDGLGQPIPGFVPTTHLHTPQVNRWAWSYWKDLFGLPSAPFLIANGY